MFVRRNFPFYNLLFVSRVTKENCVIQEFEKTEVYIRIELLKIMEDGSKDELWARLERQLASWISESKFTD